MTDRDVFHPGEKRLQRQFGSRAMLEEHGHRIIFPYLTEQHQAFFQALPYVVFASLQEGGRLRPTLLFGEVGFIRIVDDDLISICLPKEEAQLQAELSAGDAVAMLGIDFETRRRNRLNGRVRAIDESIVQIEVEQAFGNCPKYIQQRQLVESGKPVTSSVRAMTTRESNLSGEMLEIVKRADTAFIASQSAVRQDNLFGVDVSHRGGVSGFIQAEGRSTLRIPDYSGNRFFNTLGNLLENSSASLLIVDFEQGHLLRLYGKCEINMGPPLVDWPAGAECLLVFSLEEAELQMHALSARWKFKSYSPFLPQVAAESPV